MEIFSRTESLTKPITINSGPRLERQHVLIVAMPSLKLRMIRKMLYLDIKYFTDACYLQIPCVCLIKYLSDWSNFCK